ncbi:MAG: NAD(+) synthase [Gammaproteobacteria bacterium]|nr:NAD(+) synthase [Gammaproteobacteria bacterium]
MSGNGNNFLNCYSHGFARAAVAIPEVRVADPEFNTAQTLALMQQAADGGALLVAFPELGLSAYTCDDLFHQQALLESCVAGLGEIVAVSGQLPLAAVVGVPLRFNGLLFNCAAVVAQGRILGIVPKSFQPNYREYYEQRYFASGYAAYWNEVELCGQTRIPFGSQLLFRTPAQPWLVFHVEICEDLWVPIPPSSYAALAGATVLVNLSASNATVAKAEYRRELVDNQSARCMAAYIYSASGYGESTTDLAWDGHGMIYENGVQLAEAERFRYGSQLITADIDLERLIHDRTQQNSFAQSVQHHTQLLAGFRSIEVSLPVPPGQRLDLQRRIERFPYIPADLAHRGERCREIYEIQVQGLVKRLRAMHSDKVVIGVSGGLDSTQGLLVCCRAMDVMRLPRANILAYTLPGFGTSERTLQQARVLMQAVGVSAHEIDIRDACMQMFRNIGHPYASGQPVYDTSFENVQAGERTSLLFRLANQLHAPVVGTSDLSELALGWCTYGVGDQMAHYHVNASVPKTLIQHLIRWVAESNLLGGELASLLQDVLATRISPELIPGEQNHQPVQRTEGVTGPYELQDFNLYYLLRFGYAPEKVAYLAWAAWRDRTSGEWPDIPQNLRHQYTLAEIKHWLKVFVRRFFEQTQYKRSCIANAPKVGSGGSLSPRGDYRAPSDSQAAAWLASVERIPAD